MASRERAFDATIQDALGENLLLEGCGLIQMLRFILILFSFNFSCAHAHPIDVSIGELLSTPEHFNGKEVRVIGYFYARGESLDGDAFDDVRLFSDKSSFDNYIYTNSISLILDRMNHSGFGLCDGQLVEVVGSFSASRQHLARLGSGYSNIVNIVEISTWVEYSSELERNDCLDNNY